MLRLPRPGFSAGFFVILFLSGCATYQGKVEESRLLMQQGRYSESISKLEPLAAEANRDQLVYLMDLGIAYQVAGKFEDSNKVLLRADRLSENLDYHSVTNVSSSILLNEEMVQYKGDTFEKIFINANMAMNYLALDNLDDALVEARRINEKYRKFRSDEKKNFELNTYGLWLSALIWEAAGSYDDAFIAYKNAWELEPSNFVFQKDLLRAAKLSKRDTEFKKYKKLYPQIELGSEFNDKSQGELVILVQQGWGPRKVQDQQHPRFPLLSSVYSQTQSANVQVGDLSLNSEFVYDLDRASKLTLIEDRASLVARRLGGIVAKEVVADQVRQKDELLGFLVAVAVHASDRPDLRQWSTLPSSIQVIRLKLSAGAYSIKLQGLDSQGGRSIEAKEFENVSIKPNKKSFVLWRTLQ